MSAAPRNEAKSIFSLKPCLPTAPGRLIEERFGTSPFFEQLSDKQLFARLGLRRDSDAKDNRCREISVQHPFCRQDALLQNARVGDGRRKISAS